MHSPIAATSIESLIIDVRGERVLLDADVAALYGVETRAVNQAVRRNLDKFPNGYILELTSEESAYLREAKDSRSQIVILNT